MNVLEAIRTRRTIGKVKQNGVPRELIERILEAASWAPSHFNTQPWKFIVMTGEGRAKLGEGYALTAEPAFAGLSAEEREEKLAKERAKAFRSPVVIAAVCSPSDDKRALPQEELAACHAAVQNLLLAAHAEGLGAIWRSGEPMYSPLMKQPFGLGEQESLVGLIYLGYPDMEPPSVKRAPVSDKTVWIEDI